MSTIDEVRQRIDLAALVSEYLRLEKSGARFRGLCPFHPEKTPSFTVYPDSQRWRCFGCGAGGDAFTFIMKKEGIDFGEALNLLAQKAGVTLARERPRKDEGERLYGLLEEASRFYARLLSESAAGQKAREYAGRRGLTHEIMEEFQLGYAPDSWDSAKGHLLGLGYREQDLVGAGLLVEKEGRTYDRFRHRLMFPIRDASGRAVAFGSRALDAETEPKYLNSPETPVFEKGSILYAFDRAREAIRAQKAVVVVEGYMDALAAHQFGMKNVIASMGTALTDKQVRMLKGVRAVALALDPDEAGKAATLRGIEVCRHALERQQRAVPGWMGATSVLSTELKIIPLPAGKDPDNLIREDWGEWTRLVDEAVPFVDYLFSLVESGSLDYRNLLPLITETGDEVQRELYLGRLARLLGVNERTLAQQAAHLGERAPAGKGRSRRPARGSMPGDGAQVAATRAPTGDRLEEYCLGLLIRYPELRHLAGDLLPEHFQQQENREVFAAWTASVEALGTGPGEGFAESLEPSLLEHLRLLNSRPWPALEVKDQEVALDDCLRRLHERRLRAVRESLEAEADAALSPAMGGESGAARLAELEQRERDINARIRETWRRAEGGVPPEGEQG